MDDRSFQRCFYKRCFGDTLEQMDRKGRTGDVCRHSQIRQNGRLEMHRKQWLEIRGMDMCPDRMGLIH